MELVDIINIDIKKKFKAIRTQFIGDDNFLLLLKFQMWEDVTIFSRVVPFLLAF